MSAIVEEVKLYSFALLKNSRCHSLPFHNSGHTLEVFNLCGKIGLHEKLSAVNAEILNIAALFHDTGYAEVYQGHEEVSIKKAEDFLRKIDYSASALQKVLSCIEATKMPQQPSSLLQMIICDADLAHFADVNFPEKNEALRKEWAACLNRTFSDEKWLKSSVAFLESQQYFTKYGKDELEKGKQRNLALLRSKLNAL